MFISSRFTFFLKCERSNNLVKLSLKINQVSRNYLKGQTPSCRIAWLCIWSFGAFSPRLSDDTAEWIKWPTGRPTGRGRSRCFEFHFWWRDWRFFIFLFSQRASTFRAVISHSRRWLAWPLTHSVLRKSFLCSSSVPVADTLCLHLETSIISHCTRGLLISHWEYGNGS